MKKIFLRIISNIYGNPKALPLLGLGTVTVATSTAFAANDIGTIVSGVMALLLNFLTVYGVIYLVLGIKSLAGAMSDDGGQDQQALAKGKGQVIRGAVCVAAGSIIQLIVGVNPTDIGSIFTS